MEINRIVLAPMEGVLDFTVRKLLTEINHFDYCVTEFVRVTHHLLSNRTFYRLCPELYHQGKTESGTPVRVQILGSSPGWMAENAAKAISMGSYGIDINCGCPAKTVVGSHGGAYLLQFPELIYQITKAVRNAISPDQNLSVKMRLGWEDKNSCFEVADAIQQGGANEIVIHGRTKQDGYKADKIDWATVGCMKQQLTIPVIANGEIFSITDAKNCIKSSKTEDIMLARGVLNTPNLANMIRLNEPPIEWHQVLSILLRYAQSNINHSKPLYHSARIKQWLSYLKQQYEEAALLLQQVRTLKTQQELVSQLQQYITDKKAS